MSLNLKVLFDYQISAKVVRKIFLRVLSPELSLAYSQCFRPEDQKQDPGS